MVFYITKFLTPHRGAATIDTLAAKAAHPEELAVSTAKVPVV
jgi:hypothetical protein